MLKANTQQGKWLFHFDFKQIKILKKTYIRKR